MRGRRPKPAEHSAAVWITLVTQGDFACPFLHDRACDFSRTVARLGPDDLGQRLLPTQELDEVIWSAYWSYQGNLSEGIRVELKRADDGEKGFEKVFAFLRDRLLAGSLKPGDRLVSERDLAIQLGVGRPLVREALRALTMLGIVEIRDRIGTVVTRPDVSVLNDFFTFALAQQADMPDDVMQARVAIECQAIRLACERADIADFERLQAALARIAETINESDAGGMADFEFHRTMVLASHSQTLAVLHNSMAGLLTHVHRNRRELVQAFPSMKTYLIDDHRRIFEAVVARDPDRADATLRKHFQIGDEYRRRAIVGETDSITASPAANLQTRKRANSRKIT
jgi:DNA-binding FadR family transcriptional regulator